MTITLNIGGKDKDFTTPFISARKLRETIAMSANTKDTKQDAGMIDKMVDYIVDIFGKQFTADQFYDGIEANKVISTFQDCVQEVTGNLTSKVEEINKLSPNA